MEQPICIQLGHGVVVSHCHALIDYCGQVLSSKRNQRPSKVQILRTFTFLVHFVFMFCRLFVTEIHFKLKACRNHNVVFHSDSYFRIQCNSDTNFSYIGWSAQSLWSTGHSCKHISTCTSTDNGHVSQSKYYATHNNTFKQQ